RSRTPPHSGVAPFPVASACLHPKRQPPRARGRTPGGYARPPPRRQAARPWTALFHPPPAAASARRRPTGRAGYASGPLHPYILPCSDAGRPLPGQTRRIADQRWSAPIGGKDFPGVHEPLGIEHTPNPIHHFEVSIGEDVPDILALLQADAMLTGHRPAGVGAELQDLIADAEHGFILTRHEGVEEHERVHVAISGVEDIADLEAGPG